MLQPEERWGGTPHPPPPPSCTSAGTCSKWVETLSEEVGRGHGLICNPSSACAEGLSCPDHPTPPTPVQL